MSGPLAVPFAIAAVYVEGNWQKAGFAVLAIVCAVYASFSIWKVERIARNTAEDQAAISRAQADSLKTEADTLRAEATALRIALAERPSASPPPAGSSTGFSFVGNTGLEARDNIALTVSLPRDKFSGVGRNDPCPCGSGKKFKNCHGIGLSQ
jgi:uncharacterized protein YecA (UPF0149 family)